MLPLMVQQSIYVQQAAPSWFMPSICLPDRHMHLYIPRFGHTILTVVTGSQVKHSRLFFIVVCGMERDLSQVYFRALLSIPLRTQDYSTILTTNLESAFKLCQLFRPLLQAAGSSSILFNSSVAGGPLAMFSGSLYAMTKAALNQLTKNLAVEWARDGIRVNAVAPWYTATPLAMQVCGLLGPYIPKG